MNELEALDSSSLKGALEAMLLVSSDPVSAPALASILSITPGECASLLAELQVEYQEKNRGIQLREVAGGWRLFTHPAFHEQVEALVLSWDTQRLSQAALETLAVIAYHQPVTREMVKGIRGVNSDGVISSLVDKVLFESLGVTPNMVKRLSMEPPARFLRNLACAAQKTFQILSSLHPMSSRASLFASVSPADLSSRRSRRPTMILKKNANSSIWKKTIPTA